MAVAADALGERGELQREAVVRGGERSGDLVEPRLVVGDEAALALALSGVAEGVERGAAHDAQLGQQLEGVAYPRPVAPLLQLARAGIARRGHGRGEVEAERDGPVELGLELLEERRLGPEPGDLVLVLAGHQLEELARDGPRRLVAADRVLFHRADLLDPGAVALGPGPVLIAREELDPVHH